MKLFKKLIFIFLSIGALISCDGMNATYKEFIEEGPIVYIGNKFNPSKIVYIMI